MTTAARTTVNALGVDVLRKAALIGAELDRPDAEVAALRSDADALATRMNQTLRKADGTYVDGLLADGTQSTHAGQHATSYAIAFGVAPAQDVPALGEQIAAQGMKQGPMTAHVLLEALAEAGAGESVLNLLTNEDDYGWAGWLADGGTFTPEAWELSGSANSASHGWGSRGIVDVTESVLGIRTTAPGAAEVELGVPATGLTHAKGSVATQRGRVASSWTRTADSVTLRATIPVNVTAVVRLPEGSYLATGPGRAIPERLGTENGITSYRIGSGRWTFEKGA